MSDKRFRVAFSFAGEKRDFVAQVAAILADRFEEPAILYDEYHEAEFARARLGRYLPKLYHEESDLVVVVICPDYARKNWTGLEWDAVFDLLKNREEAEVMLCRFEYATVDGLFSDAGYVELDNKTPEQTATVILQRLALNEGKPKDHYGERPVTDPQHWERLHPQQNVFDHLSQHQQWHVLSAKAVEDFLGKARVQIQDDFLTGLSALEQFRRFKFIGDDGNACNGAYLCFGDSPDVTIPGATTKCYHWKGGTRSAGFYDDLESRRGLLEQFQSILGFLKRTLRLERQITEEGRADVLEIPLDVLEEAVANALVHREYDGRHESVVVSVYEDRVEIISPGLLPPPLELSTISQISISHPRNPQIARIFYLSGHVERAGSGIERITSSLEARGLPPPEFDETEDKCFKVILKRPAQTSPPADALAWTPPNNLPRLQSFFGRTDELKKIADAVTPKTRTWGVLIDGPGGMGKTSLAIRAAELAPPGQFLNIFFLSSKERKLTAEGERKLSDFVTPGYLDMLNEMARLLKQPDLAKQPETERTRLLIDALAPAKALLILDNLESMPKDQQNQLFEFLSQLPPGCKAIVTSRRRTDVDARIIRLAKLDQDAARELIAELATDRPLLAKASAEERIHLYEETGGNPLLLRWIAGQLGRGRCRNIAGALDLARNAAEENDPLEFIFGDLLATFTENEIKVLSALTYFTQQVEVKLVAELASISRTSAETALGDLSNRALVVPDEEEKQFALVPMVADFLRSKRPEVVTETGNRLEQRAYALAVKNGYSKHNRFPILEEAWPTVAPALPLFVAGPNGRLQTVCSALRFFFEFTGHWDEWRWLEKQAEAKAVAAGDHENAGWRAYQAGWIHNLRQQSDAVLACAERAAAHWQTAKASARERAFAIRLRGIGHELKADYPAAIAAFREALDLHRTLSAESDDVAIAMNALAAAEQYSGRFDKAQRDYREALRVARAAGYAEGVAYITGNLADLALVQEDWSGAETLTLEALPLAEGVGRLELIASNCRRLAEAFVRQGKGNDALPYAQRAVEIYTQLGSPKLEDALKVLKECEESTKLSKSKKKTSKPLAKRRKIPKS